MQTNEDRTVEVVPRDYSYVFNPYREPIAKVKPEERVTIHTEDAFESRITKKENLPSRALATAKFLNPQTGPVFVEGAEPGDTLAVRIESIEPTRDFAVSVLIPYFGGLTSTNLTRTLQEPLPEKVWIWDLIDGGNNLVNEELGVKLPWDPSWEPLPWPQTWKRSPPSPLVPSGATWMCLTSSRATRSTCRYGIPARSSTQVIATPGRGKENCAESRWRSLPR